MKSVASALALWALVVASTPARAQPSENAYVTMEQLEARVSPGELTLQYKVDPRSWQWLQERRLQPELVLFAPGRRNLEVRRPLLSSEDTLRIRVPGHAPMRLDEVTVSIEGGNRRGQRIGWMELAGVQMTKVTLRVTRGQPDLEPPLPPPPPQPPPPPPPPPPGPNWAALPEVISACGSTFDGSRNEIACLDAVAPFQVNPLSALRSCESSMDGDDAELECVKVASRAPGDTSRALSACDSAMDGDSSELTCFREVIRARYEPSRIIQACDFAMDGDAQELECVRVAMNAGQDPSASLQACERGMGGDTEELECFRRTLPR